MKNDEMNLSSVEDLLKGITIPPQPTALQEINAERAKADVDLGRIAQIISNDITLSAGVLKVVNSPYFGVRTKITSIAQAVQLLGLTNIFNIVSCTCLRNSFKNLKPEFMNAFWEQSTHIASISSFIATQIKAGVKSDEAYTLGLFSNCGIPLMLQRFPNYYIFTKDSRHQVETESIINLEEKNYSTNHCAVGYFMGRSWALPEQITHGILHHHDLDDEALVGDNKVRSLISIVRLADHFSNVYHKIPADFEWNTIQDHIFMQLGISMREYVELRDDVREEILFG